MHTSTYLRIRLARTRRITLSVPGVERALRNERLPKGAEALIETLGIWVPLAQHPAVRPILVAMDTVEPVTAVAGVAAGVVLPTEEQVDQAAELVPARLHMEPVKSGTSAWRRHILAVQRWAAAL